MELEKTVTLSWWTRIKNSIMGILVGVLLVLSGIVLIFWNENHSIKMELSLLEAEKAVIQAPNKPILSDNNQKLIYTTGVTSTKENLIDPLLNVELNAIHLDRVVEMYQWKEKIETSSTNNLGGSETETKKYSYDKVWSKQLIDSTTFENSNTHQNPKKMLVENLNQTAKNVHLGDFILNKDLISQINNYESITLTEDEVNKLQTELSVPVSLMNDGIFVGKDPNRPDIGDLKINLAAVYPEDISVIAVQNRNQFEPYKAKNGENILLLEVGQVSSAQMISNALEDNKVMMWIIRMVCLIILVIGYYLILNPIVVFADVLPFLGSIIGFGSGFISLIAGLSTWGIITAIAWFIVRPLFSVSILAIIGIAITFLSIKRKNKLQQEQLEKPNEPHEHRG